MDLLRTVTCVTFLALAGGCATHKPAMPDNLYGAFATNIVVVMSCGQTGQMPADVSALGANQLRASLETYAYDMARLRAAVDAASSKHPSNTECNDMAVQVHARKQQIDRGNAMAAADQKAWETVIQNNQVKQTDCHAVGLQLSCTTR